jgi:raffinose/stachyose/melibiose transport system permease protein
MALLLRRTVGLWRYVVATTFAIIFGFPLIWMMYSSFKGPREIIRSIWSLPSVINLNGYAQVFASSSFGTYYVNSLIMVALNIPILTIASAMASYAFARAQFRGKTLLFYLFLGGITIPIHVTLIPIFIMMRDLNLLGKLFSMVLPFVGFGLPVSIFILRGFFEQIPIELEEAARVDGASTPYIFWRIAIPLARPALVTVIILNIVGSWNEYLFALTLVGGNNQSYTLPLGIYSFSTTLGQTLYDKLFAGLTVATLPVLIVYFLAQRQIIKSLTAGALAGQ